MKYSIIVLCTAASAFLIGCDNQSINNPVATGDLAASTAAKAAQPQAKDLSVIVLNHKLEFSDGGDAMRVGHVAGIVSFDVSPSARLKGPLYSDNLYDVSISTKGEITLDKDSEAWVFGGSSMNQVRLFAGDQVTLKKSYTIERATRGLDLVIEFTVAETTVWINRVYVSTTPHDNTIDPS